jgi:hypothetical protein
MTEPTNERKSGEYLSDVKIAQILILDKIAISQRKIASLLKYNRKTVQNALATFLFETFTDGNITRKHEQKTTECEDRYNYSMNIFIH